MSVRRRKYAGYVLLAVYAFFFASTNFFYHSHQLLNSRLVHSHPFNGANHSHTTNQIVLIGIVDSAVFDESSSVEVPDVIPVQRKAVCRQSVNGQLPVGSIIHYSLRAPPAEA